MAKVNWRRVLWICAVFLIVYVGNRDCTVDTGAASACKVAAQPKLSLAPLRFVRVKVTIEDGTGGVAELVGPDGLETSSLVQAGPKTTWIEWKNVVLIPGDYDINLRGRTCTARDRIQVAGGDGH